MAYNTVLNCCWWLIVAERHRNQSNKITNSISPNESVKIKYIIRLYVYVYIYRKKNHSKKITCFVAKTYIQLVKKYFGLTFYVSFFHIRSLNLQWLSMIYGDHYLSRLFVALAICHCYQLPSNPVAMDTMKTNVMHSTVCVWFFGLCRREFNCCDWRCECVCVVDVWWLK